MVMTWGWFRAWHLVHTAVDFPQKIMPSIEIVISCDLMNHLKTSSRYPMCSLHGLKQHDLVLLKDAHLAGGLEPWNFMTFHLLGIIMPTFIYTLYV